MNLLKIDGQLCIVRGDGEVMATLGTRHTKAIEVMFAELSKSDAKVSNAYLLGVVDGLAHAGAWEPRDESAMN